MSARPAIDLKPRTFLELLDLTFAVYKRDFLLYTAISAVIAAPVGLITMLIFLARYLIGESARWLLYPFLPFIQYAYRRRDLAVYYAASARLMGRPCHWRTAYTQSPAGFWEVIQSGCGRGFVAGVVGGIGIFIVFVLADILKWSPAVTLALLFVDFLLVILVQSYFDAPAQIIPAIELLEGVSEEAATQRCQTLAAGQRNQLFLRQFWLVVMLGAGLFVPILVASLGVLELSVRSFAYEAGINVVRLDGAVVAFLVTLTAGTSVSAPILAIYRLLTYIDLRIRVEHLDLEVLAGGPFLAAANPDGDKPPLFWWRDESSTTPDAVKEGE